MESKESSWAGYLLSYKSEVSVYSSSKDRGLVFLTGTWIYKCWFIFEREKVWAGGGAEREGGRGSKAGSVLIAENLMQAQTHEPWDCDLSQICMLNQLSPQKGILKYTLFWQGTGWGRGFVEGVMLLLSSMSSMTKPLMNVCNYWNCSLSF